MKFIHAIEKYLISSNFQHSGKIFEQMGAYFHSPDSREYKYIIFNDRRKVFSGRRKVFSTEYTKWQFSQKNMFRKPSADPEKPSADR